MKIHLKPKEKPEKEFNCIICSKTYGSKDSLTRHMKTSHLQKEYHNSAGFGGIR